MNFQRTNCLLKDDGVAECLEKNNVTCTTSMVNKYSHIILYHLLSNFTLTIGRYTAKDLERLKG